MKSFLLLKEQKEPSFKINTEWSYSYLLSNLDQRDMTLWSNYQAGIESKI